MKESAINMSDSELRIRGIYALNQALGVSAAHKFLSLIHQEPTDYVRVSRTLYEGQTVDEIFARARQRGMRDEGGDRSTK
jgi:hypothetical protein